MLKKTLKIAITGHVDHGKSTLIGRLMLNTRSLPKEKIAEIKNISEKLGKAAELAFLTDYLKEEREQNKTIETTQVFLKSKDQDFIIIDTPGHVSLLKNMITGACKAEHALLVIDIMEGMREQTKRHLYILKMLGIRGPLIVFNKMDLAGYKKENFTSLKSELIKFLEQIGLSPSFIIPVSAKKNVNISTKSAEMRWYEGPCLLKALRSLSRDKKIPENHTVFPVQDIYKINSGIIIAGRVESGILKKGMEMLLLPYHKPVKIASIEVFGKPGKTKAEQNEAIGITLNDGVTVKRGDMLVEKNYQPKITAVFKGTIFWLSKEPLEIRKEMTLRCSTQETACLALQIEKRINSSTLKLIEKNAKKLYENETGMVEFKTTSPVIMESFSIAKALGSFIIEVDDKLSGIGIMG